MHFSALACTTKGEMMQNLAEKILRKIDGEKKIITKMSTEVTRDWQEEHAIVRLRAFEEVYKLFEGNAVEAKI